MTNSLENQYLQFALDPQRACWRLYPRSGNTLSLESVRMQAAYRCHGGCSSTLDDWPAPQLSEVETQPSPHGSLSQLNLSVGPDPNGLCYRLTFALPDEYPLFLWKLTIYNDGPHPAYIDRLTLCSSSINSPSTCEGKRSLRSNTPFAFFSNGWQSWSYAGVYFPSDRFHHTRLGPLRTPTDVNTGTPQPNRPGHFASDMFGVLGDRHTRRALLVGFLSQINHFGTLEVWLNTPKPLLRLWANGDGARLDPFATINTDWACLHFLDLETPDPLAPYLTGVSRQNQSSSITSRTKFGIQQSKTSNLKSTIPSGWCSWYQFSSEDYTGALTARDIQDNLHAIAHLRSDLPLEVIQIDDGFESQIGDWFSFSPGFPDGVAPLAAEIRRSGFTPGLWLAPFIVHPKSRLFADHPDWLLRGRFNRPINAGYLWNTFTTALDLTHPSALDYVREVVYTAVHQWGFPYLKLDFLYAAALHGRYGNPTCTRAMVLHTGLQAIREAAGNQAFLLGCGCPLGPAVGLVDAMRISADVARRWKPSFNGMETFFEAEPSFPSARNATHNSLSRAPLHRRWWVNDPDCLLVRPETHLTLAEVQTLSTVISLTGGSFLLSDHLPDLPTERLRLVQSLLPPIGLRPRLPDWFDSTTPRRLRLDLENASGTWHLLALFNWNEQPQTCSLRLEDYGLEPGIDYFARMFWSGETYRISAGILDLPEISAHGVALLAVRTATPGQPQYLGSDLHISQGLELDEWHFAPPASLSLCLFRPGHARGSLDLYLPSPPISAILESHPLSWEPISDFCYRFMVEFTQNAKLHITW